MIESIIISTLAADTALAGYVTTYGSAPAIFAEDAPEDAEEPNITIRILWSSGPDSIVRTGTIYVDFWDYDKSRANSRAAAERIEFLLDNKQFNHTRYANIRLWIAGGSPIDEEDPRAIHYNLQFEVRAFRKKWIQQLDDVAATTTTTTTTAGA